GYPNYSSGRYHGGVDFPVPSGSSVYAAASGTVIIAKNLNYSYGHYLVIDHGNGLSTLYAHNTTLLVGVGSHVTKGQVIARSGSTGNSTGPHCHFEVRVNGTRVNPFNYL
ncbi:MAG: M23 family metallopeptidase, partial [Clostridia bacterium]|nr:M23 family metallopeptidase [Clostridia bacterium]